MFFKKTKQMQADIIELQNSKILEKYPKEFNLEIEYYKLRGLWLSRVLINQRLFDYIEKLNMPKYYIKTIILYSNASHTEEEKAKTEKKLKEFENSFLNLWNENDNQ